MYSGKFLPTTLTSAETSQSPTNTYTYVGGYVTRGSLDRFAGMGSTGTQVSISSLEFVQCLKEEQVT